MRRGSGRAGVQDLPDKGLFVKKLVTDKKLMVVNADPLVS